MNGIVILSDGYATVVNGILPSDNIITSNITTDSINLHIENGRHLSVFDDLNNKAYYSDIICLSGIIYDNNNLFLEYKKN